CLLGSLSKFDFIGPFKPSPNGGGFFSSGAPGTRSVRASSMRLKQAVSGGRYGGRSLSRILALRLTMARGPTRLRLTNRQHSMQINLPDDRACDILVIGGGPAGSTVSTLLARQGHQVVLVDKDQHPRFHIGESLLPANMPLLDQLGVGEEVRAIGMHKPGAEFVSPLHAHTQTYYFADAWDKSMPGAYQVKRADFDHILLRNAARHGVQVHENTRATEVQWAADGQHAAS